MEKRFYQLRSLFINMEKRILTIQDISCVGQCSTTVALPIISACGIETAILPSALLSTHTAGFKGFTCLPLTNEFAKIMNHWSSEGISFDGIYTGYVLKDQIDIIINLCKQFNRGPKIIDPVMADHGKFYYGFDSAFAEKMCELCHGADVILPNLTEAAFLLGEEPCLSGYNKKYIENLLYRLAKKLKVKNVVLTGVSFDEGRLGVGIYSAVTGEVAYYFNRLIERNFHGTGDIYSSSFVGAYLSGKSLYDSAAIAVDFTVKAMELTLDYQNEHTYGVFFEQALPYLIGKIYY